MTEYRGYTLCPVTEKFGAVVMWMVYDPTMKLIADLGELGMAQRWVDQLLEGQQED